MSVKVSFESYRLPRAYLFFMPRGLEAFLPFAIFLGTLTSSVSLCGMTNVAPNPKPQLPALTAGREGRKFWRLQVLGLFWPLVSMVSWELRNGKESGN